MFSLPKMLLAGATLAAAALLPAAANAANGYVTASVNMRAGPSTSYPPITVVPDGATVDIFGCLTGFSWCDVGWRGYRGWVSSNYLDYFSDRRRYRLPEYGARYGVPIISFSFGYWDRYYRDRPFYRDRDRWFDGPPRHRPPRLGEGAPPRGDYNDGPRRRPGYDGRLEHRSDYNDGIDWNQRGAPNFRTAPRHVNPDVNLRANDAPPPRRERNRNRNRDWEEQYQNGGPASPKVHQ